MRIFRKEVTVSTNLDARSGQAGDVFLAEFQTGGRGRLDHRWQSPKGANLTFSVVMDVGDASPAEVATLPLVVGLSVVDAVKTLLGKDGADAIALKWPNDVFFNGRKLCGILCERNGDSVIAGVGINVNQVDFPSEIAVRATSLFLSAGRPFDRETVLSTVLAALEVRHRQWMKEGFAALHPDFAAIDYLKGRTISVYQTDADPEPLAGLCEGIQPDGTIRVGGASVFAGEAHVVL